MGLEIIGGPQMNYPFFLEKFFSLMSNSHCPLFPVKPMSIAKLA